VKTSRWWVVGGVSAVAILVFGAAVWAQTVDFEAFWIRNNGSAVENVHQDGASFEMPAAGDKAGYGTHFLDGQPLSSLQSIDWMWVDGAGPIPYLNIWFTDGTNYAIAAPQTIDYEYRASHLAPGQDIGDVYVKVYEYESLDWMTPGITTREGAGYLLNGGVRVTFGQLASYAYGPTIQDPGVYGSWVGTGPPKNGTGLNIIYGDTQSNYVDTYKIKHLTLNGIATAVPVTFAVNPDGTGDFTTIQEAVDAAYAGDTINVAAGTYTEWQDNGYGQSAGIIIDKPLHLQGSGDDCVIRGKTGTTWYMPSSPILWVKANDVEIDHFKFDGATYTKTEPRGLRSHGIQSAWKVGSTDYAATNLNVHHNTFVYIGTAVRHDRAGGGNITIANNTIVRETRSIWYDPPGATPGSYVDRTLGGGGFTLWYVDGTVQNNTGIETPGIGTSLFFCSDITLEGNQVLAPDKDSPSDAGIHLQGCTRITLRGNTISNFTHGDNPYYNHGMKGAGIHITGGNDSITIECNDLIDNSAGIYVGATAASSSPTNIEVHQNNISNNAHYGVLNIKYPASGPWKYWDYHLFSPAGSIIDATNNWWGDAKGPYHPTIWTYGSQVITNPDGKGDEVSDYVLYDPWYRPTTPMASFAVDHAKIDFKKKPDDDKVRVQGRLKLDLVGGDDVDISEEVIVTVGPLSETITMVEKGKKGDQWEYKRPKDGEGIIKHMTIDWKDGRFDIRIDDVDLDSSKFPNPVAISVQIGDDVGSESILMSEKKHHWDYKVTKPKAVEIGPFAITDELKVVAYPNPIREVHTATFQVMGILADQVEEIRVQIFDLSGRLVWEDAALGPELDWHTDSLSGDYLANGMYLYRVQVRIDGNWINQDTGSIAVLR
jgi:hypothetical protein